MIYRTILVTALSLLFSVNASAEKIVLVSDSLTAPAPCCEEWASTLAWMVEPWLVTNDALGGSTLYQWAGSFDPWAIGDMPADVVTILLGSNDSAQGRTVSDYRVLIRWLISQAQTAGAAEILLMAPPDHPSLAGTPARDLLLGYRAEVAAACAELEGVTCGPDLWTLLGPDDFGPDGTHFNQQGHDEVAAAVFTAVPEPPARDAFAAGLLCLAALWCWRERPRGV